jgi:amidophosphoribosyltransferase
MCGVVGIFGRGNVNQALFDALTVLQHRGQDAAGMVTSAKRQVLSSQRQRVSP